MIILAVGIVLVVAIIWLPLHYGINGDKNLPPAPPPTDVFYVVPQDWSDTPKN